MSSGCAWGLLFLALALPTRAPVQVREAAESPLSAFRALEAGDSIRFRAVGALDTEGSFLALDGRNVLLGLAEEVRRVAVDRIEALWVRRRATKKGALFGTVTGAILGVGHLRS